MKPSIDFRRCFASKNVCTAIKCCPVNAVSFIEVDVPVADKFLNCNCANPDRTGKIPVSCTDSTCGCGCESENKDPLYACGGTPYGRIVIDHDKCTKCGLCVKECCGSAIGMYPDDYVIEPVKGKLKNCSCENACS